MLPSRDDLVEHRVVVTTLSTSRVFLDLQVLHGFFTHILIDEAAQALEPEALTPLIFAGPNTKVVFTGDHMQVLFFMQSEEMILAVMFCNLSNCKEACKMFRALTGFELMTSALPVRCSNQLSYETTHIGEQGQLRVHMFSLKP